MPLPITKMSKIAVILVALPCTLRWAVSVAGSRGGVNLCGRAWPRAESPFRRQLAPAGDASPSLR